MKLKGNSQPSTSGTSSSYFRLPLSLLIQLFQTITAFCFAGTFLWRWQELLASNVQWWVAVIVECSSASRSLRLGLRNLLECSNSMFDNKWQISNQYTVLWLVLNRFSWDLIAFSWSTFYVNPRIKIFFYLSLCVCMFCLVFLIFVYLICSSSLVNFCPNRFDTPPVQVAKHSVLRTHSALSVQTFSIVRKIRLEAFSCLVSCVYAENCTILWWCSCSCESLKQKQSKMLMPL